MSQRPRIDVEIDELVVTGVPGVGRDEIAAAVGDALQRRLAATGLDPQLLDAGYVGQVDAAPVPLTPTSHGADSARPIAGAIATALGGKS